MDLVLTLDYELFGNGKGDVFHHIVYPTNDLLEVCDRNNIRITLFFEVLEYLRIKEEWGKGNDMGYQRDPGQAIEAQIIRAHMSGHDIQLHLHPQWLNARYDQGWEVDLSLWRLPEVNASKCGFSIRGLLEYGKETIEGLLKPYDPEYNCYIFRAGGYNLWPSGESVAALRDSGFFVDSSVFPGGFKNSPFSNYDYRDVSETIPYWYGDKDSILREDKERGQLLEIPIFARSIPRFAKFDIQRLFVKWKNRGYFSKTSYPSNGSKKENAGVASWFVRDAITWDFCLFSFSKMKKFFYKAQRIKRSSEFKFHPFVLIGHSKEFYAPNNFKKFIRFARKRGSEFHTLKQAYEKLSK